MRIQRHNALSMILYRWMRAAGYAARREVLIPAWRRLHQGRMQQAILDVVGSCHAHLRSRYCDITVRQPLADTYLPRSARCPGSAVQTAVLKKHQRYPIVAGMTVTACAIEIYGAMSSSFSGVVSELSFAASEEQKSSVVSARSQRGKWLTEISVALAVQAAEQVAVCAGTA